MLLEESSPLGVSSKSFGILTLDEFGGVLFVWNRLDTRFALSAFQLTPLGQSTEDNGCSLLPTERSNEKWPNMSESETCSTSCLSTCAGESWAEPPRTAIRGSARAGTGGTVPANGSRSLADSDSDQDGATMEVASEWAQFATNEVFGRPEAERIPGRDARVSDDVKAR